MHTLTLMTGYDVAARVKVVARWQELEDQAHCAWPLTKLTCLKSKRPSCP